MRTPGEIYESLVKRWSAMAPSQSPRARWRQDPIRTEDIEALLHVIAEAMSESDRRLAEMQSGINMMGEKP